MINKLHGDLLELIGNTPMVELSKMSRGLSSKIFAKLEYYNPSGSIKDRIGLSMIEEAENAGLIKPGDTIVEPTSGNTGTSLALVCALKGYRMIAVMPAEMSTERQAMMRAFGAELILIPSKEDSASGTFSKEELESTIEKAREMSKLPGHYMPDQFSNPANTLAHYRTTAKEIWEQMNGNIDIVVISVGTAGTAMGVGRGLKERDPSIELHVVEPLNSAVLSGEAPGYHRIQGIGEGFIPELYDSEVVDEIIKVSDEEAKITTCQLSRKEGIFAGYSAGANVFAALTVARKQAVPKQIVTLIPDSGMKYLSTELYQRNPDLCISICCDQDEVKERGECLQAHEYCCVLIPCSEREKLFP
ncbi:MAG: cysteine synthase A [Candidatus Glassbacteria bacterium]